MTNTTFPHKSLASNRIMHGQLNQLHIIPRLYAVITAACWIFCFPFPFIHLLALPTGCRPYALLSIITKEFSFHLIISILPSLLKSKDPFRFFHFLTSTRVHFIILSILIVPVALNPLVVRSYINK